MKKYHINYANGKYFESQKYCSHTAKLVGFDEVISYNYNDIDDNFKEKNKNILEQKRGAGYWLWKPYIINKTLLQINEGDILVYSDSGAYYQTSIQPLIDKLLKDNHGVLSFELKGLLEKEYTKKDTFKLMNLDTAEYTETSQREATFIWLIKNNFTLNLISEYLNFAQNESIISDKKSELGEDYKEFKDHRHDQSIWSLLCKKYAIEPHRLISQHGLHLINEYPNDKYGQITVHHRNPI
jgi:hypothetical protein